MFLYLSQDMPEPFYQQELASRLATMLNFNLKKLCGEKCNKLKVKNPEKYGWSPRNLLSQLIDIYLHLDSNEFAAAIASDEVMFSTFFPSHVFTSSGHIIFLICQRSFSDALFDDAVRIMKRAHLKSDFQLSKFCELGDKAKKIAEQRVTDDTEFADAPDEFRG